MGVVMNFVQRRCVTCAIPNGGGRMEILAAVPFPGLTVRKVTCPNSEVDV